MNHVLSCVKKEKERTAAFQALGLLSVAVRSEFKVYLPRVLDIIRAALPLRTSPISKHLYYYFIFHPIWLRRKDAPFQFLWSLILFSASLTSKLYNE